MDDTADGRPDGVENNLTSQVSVDQSVPAVAPVDNNTCHFPELWSPKDEDPNSFDFVLKKIQNSMGFQLRVHPPDYPTTPEMELPMPEIELPTPDVEIEPEVAQYSELDLTVDVLFETDRPKSGSEVEDLVKVDVIVGRRVLGRGRARRQLKKDHF